MIKLTRKTEYAMLSMLYMANKGPEACTSVREIAEELTIPLVLLAKILQDLKRGGYLGSVQGPSGGYMMLRTPEKIPFLDFLRVFDERVALTMCQAENKPACERSQICAMRQPLNNLNRLFMDRIRDLSLGEVLGLA